MRKTIYKLFENIFWGTLLFIFYASIIDISIYFNILKENNVKYFLLGLISFLIVSVINDKKYITKCNKCNGNGKILNVMNKNETLIEVKCNNCNGTGYIIC